MQRIEINHLGPIQHCEMNIDDFIVCTGAQASGKSTLAKSVFFFKNLKTLLFAQFNRGYLLREKREDPLEYVSFGTRFFKEIRSNFMQIFGTTWHMDPDMNLTYWYGEETYIKLSLKNWKEITQEVPNYIWIDCSEDIYEIFRYLEKLQNEHHEHFGPVQDMVTRDIERLFSDNSVVIYIPAGRSMITLLSTQLNYLYSSMDDVQKRSLDYCTQNYLERILRLKAGFAQTPEQMIYETISLTEEKINKKLLLEMAALKRQILQGEYLNRDGEERLQVSDNKYVKINFASSGQQEVVWILNVLFYYVLNNKKTYFIIEEPESHLFPNAQKLIAEYIAIAGNYGGNQVFITTHSPYILGAVNNLLYADKISSVVPVKELNAIIPQSRWLSFQTLSAYFIQNGEVNSCTDDEFQSIENEVIDGASDEINNAFDRMIQVEEKYEQENRTEDDVR